MRVALEMVPTSANVLGIDIPKGLLSYQETGMPSKVSISRGTIDFMAIWPFWPILSGP